MINSSLIQTTGTVSLEIEVSLIRKPFVRLIDAIMAIKSTSMYLRDEQVPALLQELEIYEFRVRKKNEAPEG